MRTVKKIGIGVGITAVVIIAVILALETAPVRHYVLGRLKSALAARGIALQASSLHYNLFNISATLKDVTLSSASAPDLRPILKAQSAYVNLALFPLFHHEIEIEDSQLKTPEIFFEKTEGGQTNIPPFSSSSSSASSSSSSTGASSGGSQYSIQLRSAEVSNGSIAIDDRQDKLQVQVPKWRIALKPEKAGRKLTFSTQAVGRASVQGRTVPIREVSIDALIHPNGARLQQALLRAASSKVRLQGTIENLSHPDLNLEGDADLAVEGLTKLAGLTQSASGDIHLDFSASGSPAELEVHVKTSSTELKIDDVSSLDLQAQATYDGGAKRVRVSSLDVHSNVGAVQAHGTLALSKEVGESALSAQLSNVNLRSITNLLDSKLKIASVASGSAKVSFPGLRFRELDGHAFVHLTQLSRPSNGLLPLSGDVLAKFQNGTMTFSIGGAPPSETSASVKEGRNYPQSAVMGYFAPRIRPAHFVYAEYVAAAKHRVQPWLLRNRQLRMPLQAVIPILPLLAEQSEQGNGLKAIQTLATLLRGRVTIGQNGSLSGRLHAHVTDLGEFLKRLAAIQGSSPIGVQVHGDADVTAELLGSIRRPKASLNIVADRITIAGMHSVSLHLQGRYTGTEFVIADGNASWNRGHLQLRGRVPLSNGKTFDVDLELKDAELAPVLSAVTKNIEASGTVSLTAQVRGTMHNPRISFNATGSDLQAYGEQLGKLTLAASLENHELSVRRLRLLQRGPKPESSLSGSGTYNLRSKSYSLDLAGQNFQLHHLRLPNGQVVSGVLDLNATGQGTIADPVLDLKFQAQSVKINKRDIGSLDARVDVQNGIAKLNLDAPLYSLSADGAIGVHPPYRSNLSVTTRNLDLSSLPLPPSMASLAGTVSARLHASGMLQHPVDMTARAFLKDLNISTNGFQVSSQGDVNVLYEKHTVTVQPVTLISNGLRFTLQGNLPLESSAQSGDLRVNGTVDLSAVRQAIPSLHDVGLDGTAKLDLTLKGSLKQLRPEGTLNIASGFLGAASLPVPVQNISLDATFEAGSLVLQKLAADWGGSKLSAHGAMPLSFIGAKLPVHFPPARRPANLSLDVQGLQLDHLPRVPDGFAGTASFQLTASASRPALGAMQGRIEFSQLKVEANKVPIEQEGTSVITATSGRVSIQHLQLKGPDTSLQVSGAATLSMPRAVHFNLKGETNAALASMFTNAVQVSGPVQVQVAATGPLKDPSFAGFVSLQHGQLALRDPNVAATDLTARLDLNGKRIQIGQLSGTLNGGTLSGSGGLSLTKNGVENLDLRINAQDVYLNYPEGLRTMSDLDLSLRSQQDLFVLGGSVSIRDGTFRRYINLQTQVLNFLQTGTSGISLIGQQNAFLAKLRFNVGVVTKSPLLIEDNIAKAAVITDVKLVGGYYRPSLTGRVQLEETGEVYLNGHTFYINTGVVTFTSEARIEPTLNLQMQTQVDNYDITMTVQGPAGNLTTTLVSDPALSEEDIVSVLLFGQPLQSVRGAEVNVAGKELLAYVAGGLGSALSNQLQQALGISEVRIEPSLISGEANPNVRVTIGQNITSALKLIYSMNVVDAGDQIWVGQYDISRHLQTTLTKQSDNSYRLDLHHRLQFGGTPLLASLKPPVRTVASIQFTGNSSLTEKQLRERLKVEKGDTYDFFKVQKGTDRIQNYYYHHERFEARVRLHTERTDSKVSLTVNVDPGPKVSFAYEGWNASRGLQHRVEDIWKRGVFELQREKDAEAAIRTELVKRGYLQAEVTSTVRNPAQGRKQVLFDIQRKQHSSNVQIEFPGSKQVTRSELLSVLKDAGLRDLILVEPDRVKSELQNYYRNHAFLTATVQDPTVEASNNTGAIVIPVQEGKRYRVGAVKFSGNKAFRGDLLRKRTELSEGAVFNPRMLSPAVVRIQDLYWNAGYNDMTVQYAMQPRNNAEFVDLVFSINEGKQQILKNVTVAGTDQTSPSLVRDLIQVHRGQPLSSALVAKSRSDLYDTGAFQVVDISRQTADGAGNAKQVPTDLNIAVHEVQPFRLRYGGYYDTDRGPGVIADISNKNSLGNARELGLRGRYDRNLQDGRLYFSQPLFYGLQLRSTGEGFFTRNVHSAFIDDHIGITAGQQIRIHKDYLLNYSYRIERTRIFNLTGSPLTAVGPAPGGGGPQPPAGAPGGPIQGIGSDVTVPAFGSLARRIAPLTLTLTRDTRDDLLDATRGLFYSHAIESGFSVFGSQQHYFKYFGQYYQFIPLGKPVPVPFKPTVKKPRWVYAGALRIGLAGGFGGQGLIQSERFFAGGGTTIRGFAQDQVGPANQNGIPVGGESLFILNNELRFPLFSMFDGAGFVDVGNVYGSIRDFNPIEVRKAAGLGLRIHTPWVTVRADYGFKLDRRPGESMGHFFISIGQAF